MKQVKTSFGFTAERDNSLRVQASSTDAKSSIMEASEKNNNVEYSNVPCARIAENRQNKQHCYRVRCSDIPVAGRVNFGH